MIPSMPGALAGMNARKERQKMRMERMDFACFSATFRTRDLARALGRRLARKLGLESPAGLDLTADSKRPERRYDCHDLVLLAAPVFGGRLPGPMEQRMQCLRGDGTPAVLMASFGNRAYDDALLELDALARARGFVPLAACAMVASHSLVPSCGKGRPDEEDERGLEQFADHLAAMIRQHAEDAPWSGEFVPPLPGSFPWKNYAPTPLPQSVSEACVLCGMCIRECPTRAIDRKDPAVVDAGRCICCMRCIKVCPVNCRKPDEKFIQAIASRIEPLCATRKDSEFFYAS